MDKQLDKLNNYVKNIDNSFYKEVLDYISDMAIEYTDLKDCIDDVIKDPNGLLLTDDEYIELYDRFEDEILDILNDDFNAIFKKLPTVKDYKVIIAKNAIEIVLINFMNAIEE